MDVFNAALDAQEAIVIVPQDSELEPGQEEQESVGCILRPRASRTGLIDDASR